LESQHKASNNFIKKIFSQQQVMQAENISLYEEQVVLKKDITQVNSERISILAKLKDLSRESIDSKRTGTEELQSSLLALQMDRDSLLSQIRVTEAEIQALRSRLAALEAHFLSVGISTFSDQDRSRLELLEFEINDSTGAFKKLEHELAGLSNKLESGGGLDFHGFTFAYDGELVQWFTDRNGNISIFADAVTILNAIGATVVTTQEDTLTQETAKKIALESELEASVRASLIRCSLPSWLVIKRKLWVGHMNA
jgi:predicted RNase H-like nuclease (RuvC/YqgF family)